MSNKNGVRVGQVSYGRGVFATRPFYQGGLISVILGEVIDDADYSSDYCMDLGGTLSLEPGAPFRYVNHSCRPNAQLLITPPDCPEDDPVPVMIIEAVRDIWPGDEIVIDYAWPADHAIPCHCKSPRCRGWIVAKEELKELLAREPKPAPLL